MYSKFKAYFQKVRARDIEIKNRLTVTTGEGAWFMGKEGEGPSRNMCKGLIDEAKEG